MNTAHICAAPVKQALRAGRKKRYRQNDPLPLISYEHHQSRIVVAIFLPQALDCALRVRECRRFVRQECAVGIVLFSSVRPTDGEKISGHGYLIETSPPCEASYTQSVKMRCRDRVIACNEFCCANSGSASVRGCLGSLPEQAQKEFY
jgi:hypothetical protein